MANKPPKTIAGSIGNTKYYYTKDGLIVDENGKPVSDRIIAVFNTNNVKPGGTPQEKPTAPTPPIQQKAPPTEPVEEVAEKKKKRARKTKKEKEEEKKSSFSAKLGKAALKNVFPETYGNISALRKMWKDSNDKEENEKKREKTERRYQFEEVQDSLRDNNEQLRDLVAIQERSATLLSEIAQSIGKLGGGNSLLGNLPSVGGKGGFFKKAGGALLSAAKIGAGVLAGGALVAGAAKLFQGKQENTDTTPPVAPPAPSGVRASVSVAPSSEGDTTESLVASMNARAAAGGGVPDTGTATTPAPPTAPSAPSAAVTAAKSKQTKAEDILSFKADQIRFNSDKLTFDVNTLTIESKQQQQQQTVQPNQGTTLQRTGPGGAPQGLPLPDLGKENGPPPVTMQTNNPNAFKMQGMGGRPTGTQSEYYNTMYDSLLQAAKAKGVSNPEVVARLGATQTSLETGYGKHMVGNNAFGIKAKPGMEGVGAGTQEFENGRMVNKSQRFRKYNNVTESSADYIDFLMENKRYKGVLAAKNIEEAIAAQARTGYATDPNYGAKLAAINAKFGGQAPQQVIQAALKEKAPEATSTVKPSIGSGRGDGEAELSQRHADSVGAGRGNIVEKDGERAAANRVWQKDYKGREGQWVRNGRFTNFIPKEQVLANEAPAQMPVTQSPINPAADYAAMQGSGKALSAMREAAVGTSVSEFGKLDQVEPVKPASTGAGRGSVIESLTDRANFQNAGAGRGNPNNVEGLNDRANAQKSTNKPKEVAHQQTQNRTQSSHPSTVEPGADLIFALARLLPYLALSDITNQARASHSIMQSRRMRRY